MNQSKFVTIPCNLLKARQKSRVQVILLSKSAERYNWLLLKLRYFVPLHTLLTIYRSLIAPYLTYGLVAWGQANKSSLDKLLKLQKRALRFIHSSGRSEHAILLFIDVNILPLTFPYCETIVNLMYDVPHGTSPKSIQPLLEYVSSVHYHNTRSCESKDRYIKRSRLSIQANSFSRIGAKIWNKIPLSLQNLSKNVFKRKIKQKLINTPNDEDSYIDVPEIIQKMKSCST